jgi:D-alanyl-D-alanine carboxypeptidase
MLHSKLTCGVLAAAFSFTFALPVLGASASAAAAAKPAVKTTVRTTAKAPAKKTAKKTTAKKAVRKPVSAVSPIKGGVPSQASKTALTKELDAMIGNTGTHVPGLGVIVFKDGREVYSHFAGRRHIGASSGGSDLPVTRNTRFRVASVSKMFTGFTIMQLVDQGKINLDEDISHYLGYTLRNPNFPNTPITVRMLLSHTSSLRDGSFYSLPPSVSIREYFRPGSNYYSSNHFGSKWQQPGKYFVYANINFGVLGTIIERVTGQRFDQYLKSHILNDLQTEASFFTATLSRNAFANLGTIYRKNEGSDWNEAGPWIPQCDDFRGVQPKPWTAPSGYSLSGYRPGTNGTIFAPQGGLRISYEELSHALRLLINKGVFNGRTVVRPELMNQMMTEQWSYDPARRNGDTYGGSIEAYGLSLYPIRGKGTSRVVKDHVMNLWGHTGEAYGLLAGVFVVPGTKNGFLYIMNGEAVAEDDDPRSAGKFSGNYIWEENIMNAICRHMYFGE